MSKEKADAEALEAALKLSKEEATVHIHSKDSDDTIQKILKTPINKDFLRSYAPSSSSVHLPQTDAFKEGVVESDEDTLDSPPPPPSTSMVASEAGPSADEKQPLSLRIILPKDKDPMYRPFATEKLV